MQWFKQKVASDYIAIHPMSACVGVAQISLRTADKPLVSVAELVDSALEKQQDIKRLTKQFGLKGAHCGYVLDTADYLLLQIEKPEVSEDELKQAVRWKLGDFVDYPIDEATVDIIKLPQDSSYANKAALLYVVVAKNSLVGKIAEDCAKAGIALQAIDVRVMAQRNISALLEEPNRGVALISRSQKGLMLTFTYNGELCYARQIDVEDIDDEAQMERAGLDLQRALDNFDRQFPFVPINKLWVAPFTEREIVMDAIREILYVPIQAFDLTEFLEFSPTVKEMSVDRQNRLFTVIGAALRREGAV